MLIHVAPAPCGGAEILTSASLCDRHLRALLRDAARSDFLFHEHNKIISDFSRQRVTQKTIEVCPWRSLCPFKRPCSPSDSDGVRLLSLRFWELEYRCQMQYTCCMGSINFSFVMQLLINLADRAKLRKKIDAMFNGEKINLTEDRAVLHVALRAPRNKVRCTLHTAQHGIRRVFHMKSLCSLCPIPLHARRMPSSAKHAPYRVCVQ